jgi:hypothetical protein
MLSTSHFDARGKIHFPSVNFQWEIRVFYYRIYGRESKTTKDLHTNVTRKSPQLVFQMEITKKFILRRGFQGPLKVKRHFYCCFFDDRAFVSSQKPGVDTKSLPSTLEALLNWQRKFDFAMQ